MLAAASKPTGYRCGACRRQPPPYSRLLAGWYYEPPLDAVMLAYKFRRLDYLGQQLGQRLAARLRAELSEVDGIVPVPLHWRRHWQRGFDQADLLARAIARGLGKPRVPALRRRRATVPQSRSSRSDRQRNLDDAFGLRRWSPPIVGRRLALVDDVVTTGSTLEAASRCLVAAGVVEVLAVVVARTPEPGERRT